jgi:Reverse transcriptase (RNA-dependent DNA polymerase)
LNSVSGRKIVLKRGVRQGDPLSLYIFILAMDFLVLWITKLNESQLLQPAFPGCRSCLLYTDDTLLFIKPKEQQFRILDAIMKIFGKISGLNINLQKSEMMITSSSRE